MGDIYTCETCGGGYCDDCEPSTSCDFCTVTVCPDCDKATLNSDSRHRVSCGLCLNSLTEPERKQFQPGSKYFDGIIQFSDPSADLLHNLKNI